MENLEERAKVLEISKARNKTLRDIGVGPLAVIAARDFDCNVTSIDVDEEVLEKAKEEVSREGIAEKISLEKEDATNLSYPNNKFGAAVSYAALHHIPIEKRKKFIYELHRVSKEKIIIAEFNEHGFPHSDDEYKRVDLNWLKNELMSLGNLEVYAGREMNLHVCFKK